MIIIGVDTETTSIGSGAEIIELGVAVYDTNTKDVIKSFSQLFRTDSWSKEAEEVHKISRDLCLRFGIEPESYDLIGMIGEEILDGTDDVVFLAHYAEHDYPLLIRYWPSLSEYLWVCTNNDLDHELVVRKVTSTRLSHLAIDYGLVTLNNWHRALPDADMCCRLALAHNLDDVVEYKRKGGGRYKVIAIGPYDKQHNECLKECKFRFDPDTKSWFIICDKEDVSLYMKLAERNEWTVSSIKIGIGQ